MANKRQGRGQKAGRFVALPHYMLRSAAWKRLSPVDRCVWIEATAIYDGGNNGFIALATRALGDRLNINHSTVSRSIDKLITLGFLERTKRSVFSKKRTASEYRLTHLPCDRSHEKAKKTFMRLVDLADVETHRCITGHNRCVGAPMKSGSSSC